MRFSIVYVGASTSIRLPSSPLIQTCHAVSPLPAVQVNVAVVAPMLEAVNAVGGKQVGAAKTLIV